MEPKSGRTESKAQPSSAPTLAKHLDPADVVWIDLRFHTVGSEQQKNRPWIVVTSSRFNKGPLGIFQAVPLSSELKMLDLSLPSRIRVESKQLTYQDQNLPDHLKLHRVDRVALCDQIRTLSEQRILARAGQVQRRVLDSIRAGIAVNLEL